MPVVAGYEQRLAALSRKADLAQSAREEAIDWDRSATPPRWMPRRRAAEAISQFHQGELATARICIGLLSRVSSPAARSCLDAQVDDEQHHAIIYDRYFKKLGGRHHLPSTMEGLYREAASWRGPPEGIILACHTIFEGESLQLQQSVDTWMPCPLFKEIGSVIARDEARHVAFGRIYLQEALPHLPYAERLDLFRWIRQLWFNAIHEALNRFAPPGLLALRGGKKRWIENEWKERLDALEALHLFSPNERRDFVWS